MKNLFYLVLCLLVSACTTTQNEEVSDQNSEEDLEASSGERSIGFTTLNEDWKFYLGTDEAIQVVKDLDKVWSNRNYDAMADYFTDTTWFHWSDGRHMDNPEDFITYLKETDNENVSWTTTGMYSVDFNPDGGGEHVRAGFLVSVVSDEGDTTVTDYFESYYVIEGKIVHWRQWEMKMEPSNEN